MTDTKTAPDALAYLPLAHATERTVIVGSAIHSGYRLFFVDRLGTFLADQLKIRVSAVRYLRMRAPLSVRLDRRPGVDVVGVVEVRQFAHGGLKATELLVHV